MEKPSPILKGSIAVGLTTLVGAIGGAIHQTHKQLDDLRSTCEIISDNLTPEEISALEGEQKKTMELCKALLDKPSSKE